MNEKVTEIKQNANINLNNNEDILKLEANDFVNIIFANEKYKIENDQSKIKFKYPLHF